MKSSPLSDPQLAKQLHLWQTSQDSSASTFRPQRRKVSPPTELNQLQQTLASTNQQLAAIAREQSDQKARLQALQELRSLPENIERLTVGFQDLENLQHLESLPEILQQHQMQSQKQEQMSVQLSRNQSQQGQAIAQMQQAQSELAKSVARIEKKLPGILNHPLKTILNGAELSVKHLLVALAIASVLMGGVVGALVLAFLPSMLNRTEILDRINGRVNNIEINQRKMQEP